MVTVTSRNCGSLEQPGFSKVSSLFVRLGTIGLFPLASINKFCKKEKKAWVLIIYCKRLAGFCTTHRSVIIPIILKAYPPDALL